MKLPNEWGNGETYSTLEVTVPPPFRDWTPIGNLLMIDAKIGAKQWNYEVMWG